MRGVAFRNSSSRASREDVMARHRIEVTQPPKTVLHSDVVFTVWSDGAKLGELQVSKGTLDWKPANRRRVTSLRWERFAELMEAQSG
jgi:hypothetical protein